MAEAFRADQIGSFLRPAQVKEARRAFSAGNIDRDQLTEIEDKAILNALERQKQTGIDIFSDGEFRRASFQNDVADSVEGYTESDRPAVVRIWQGPGSDQPEQQNTTQVVTGKLRQVRRLTEAQASFLKIHSPGPFKMTLPTPNQFPAISYKEGVTDKFYATRSELLWDIVKVIKSEIAALVGEQVAYIQIDAPRTVTMSIRNGALTFRSWVLTPMRPSTRRLPPTMLVWERLLQRVLLAPSISAGATIRASGTHRAATNLSPRSFSGHLMSIESCWNTTQNEQAGLSH